MIRSFFLAAALSAAISAAGWGRTGCDDTRQLRVDKMREKANAAFDASAAAANAAYRETFQAAGATYAQALANVEAAYDGSLYWVFKSAEQLDQSAGAGAIADAAARRAHDRSEAHREWASSVSDMISEWSVAMEEAETRRSALVGANAVLVEERLANCR